MIAPHRLSLTGYILNHDSLFMFGEIATEAAEPGSSYSISMAALFMF
jgi:hypothetical protein